MGRVETIGPNPDKYNLYNSIQDYVYFQYLTGTRHVVEVELGNLGAHLKDLQKVMPLLNKIIDAANDPEVAVDMEGVPTASTDIRPGGTKTNNDLRNAAEAKIFTPPGSSLYEELKAVIDSEVITGLAATYLNDVYQDLEAWENDASLSYAGWQAWYSNDQTHKDLEGAGNALVNLSNKLQEELTLAMFLYENFVKSGASMLSGVDDSMQSLTLNMRT